MMPLINSGQWMIGQLLGSRRLRVVCKTQQFFVKLSLFIKNRSYLLPCSAITWNFPCECARAISKLDKTHPSPWSRKFTFEINFWPIYISSHLTLICKVTKICLLIIVWNIRIRWHFWEIFYAPCVIVTHSLIFCLFLVLFLLKLIKFFL